jgi:Ca2+/Na+ antiporter
MGSRFGEIKENLSNIAKKLARHGGFLLLVLVAAALVSFFGPITWSPSDVFFIAVLAFVVYLAVSLIFGI